MTAISTILVLAYLCLLFGNRVNMRGLVPIGLIASSCHIAYLFLMIWPVGSHAMSLSLIGLGSLVALMSLLMIWLSPKASGYHRLLPSVLFINVLLLILGQWLPSRGLTTMTTDLWGMAHLSLALLALSWVIVTALHSGLIIFVDSWLKHRQSLPPRFCPPLTSLDKRQVHCHQMSFWLISLSLATGLTHQMALTTNIHWKLAATALAWAYFLVVLLGHRFLGWRGPTTARGTVLAALGIGLIYYGSNLI